MIFQRDSECAACPIEVSMDSSSQPAEPPAILQVIGGMYIILGSFDVVGMLSTLSLYFAPLDSQTGLMADMLRSNASFAATMRVLFLPGLLLAVLQFCSGVGLLRASALAYKVAIGCALYGIVSGLYSTWWNVTFTLPFTLTHTLQQVKNPAMLDSARNVTLASGCFKIALGLLYPIIALVLLRRASVRHYFNPRPC